MTPKLDRTIRGMWADIMEKAKEMWTCRFCGGKTTILSEICGRCGVEDCEQGQ